MSKYTYTVNKWGYRIYKNCVCVFVAETDHRANKCYNKKDIEDFTRAAEAHIKRAEALEKLEEH